MVRFILNDSIQEPNEIRIGVRKNVQEYPVQLYITDKDTILSLKIFLENYLCAYSDEQNLVIGPQLPYSLPDQLLLIQLREEHRNLFVIIQEPPPNNIPKRYLLTISEEVEINIGNIDVERSIVTTRILDLRYIHIDSIKYIRQWMYMDRYIHEIYVLATHPKIDDILYTISDNILIFPKLYRVHIQHPLDSSYKYPILHNERFIDVDNQSRVSREMLMYLYQTLLTDQYRDREDEVEIVLDQNVLHNKDQILFHPSL